LSTGQIKAGQVTEADLLGWIRFTLPAVNLALKKGREVFSGDPSTTLRVKEFNDFHHYYVLCYWNKFLFVLKS